VERVRPILRRYGGSWVAIEPQPVMRAGTWRYVRTVIVEFPSMEQAHQWYDSGEYSEIIPLRERAIDANVVMVRNLRENG
jgi:uncharacterized protein (DUF1330 family)